MMLGVLFCFLLIGLLYLDSKIGKSLTSEEKALTFLKKHKTKVMHLRNNDFDDELSRFIISSKTGIPLIVSVSLSSVAFLKHIEIKCYSFIESAAINEALKEVNFEDEEWKSTIIDQLDEKERAYKESFFRYPSKKQFEQLIDKFTANNQGVLRGEELLEKYERLYDKLLLS